MSTQEEKENQPTGLFDNPRFTPDEITLILLEDPMSKDKAMIFWDDYKTKNAALRVPNQTREEHLALPKHNWMQCKSFHCFHGNEANWTPEHKARIDKLYAPSMLSRCVVM